MTTSDFRDELHLATRGNQNAVLKILQLYAPLISHASTVAGYPDEDLQQFICLRIITALRKFKI